LIVPPVSRALAFSVTGDAKLHADLVMLSQALAMEQGRSRIPFERGHVGIHSLSAAVNGGCARSADLLDLTVRCAQPTLSKRNGVPHRSHLSGGRSTSSNTRSARVAARRRRGERTTTRIRRL